MDRALLKKIEETLTSAGMDWGHPYAGDVAAAIMDTHASKLPSYEDMYRAINQGHLAIPRWDIPRWVGMDFGSSDPSTAVIVSADGTIQAEIKNLAMPDPHDNPAKKAAYYGLDADSAAKHVMAQCRVCGGTGGSDAGLCPPCKGSGSVNKALQDRIEFEANRRHREALTGNWRYVPDAI